MCGGENLTEVHPKRSQGEVLVERAFTEESRVHQGLQLVSAHRDDCGRLADAKWSIIASKSSRKPLKSDSGLRYGFVP